MTKLKKKKELRDKIRDAVFTANRPFATWHRHHRAHVISCPIRFYWSTASTRSVIMVCSQTNETIIISLLNLLHLHILKFICDLNKIVSQWKKEISPVPNLMGYDVRQQQSFITNNSARFIWPTDTCHICNT